MNVQNRSLAQRCDIDEYLNHIIPRPRFDLLPRPISHFFGYRPPIAESSESSQPVTQPSTLLIWLFAFLGGFIGISIIEVVYHYLPLMDGHQAPIVIASFGAAAILEYNTIESPLAQPRNLLFGHFISATLGISITKLFLLLPTDRFEDLQWLAGALAVGIASAVMGATKTIHPPAGATALLAATSPQITQLGWWLLPLVLLGCSIMLVTAMIMNNLCRRFPIYWWTPVDLSKVGKSQNNIVRVGDLEKGEKKTESDFGSESGLRDSVEVDDSARADSQATLNMNSRNDQSTLHTPGKARLRGNDTMFELRIDLDKIVLPDWLEVDEWECEVMEMLQNRLRSKAQV